MKRLTLSLFVLVLAGSAAAQDVTDEPPQASAETAAPAEPAVRAESAAPAEPAESAAPAEPAEPSTADGQADERPAQTAQPATRPAERPAPRTAGRPAIRAAAPAEAPAAPVNQAPVDDATADDALDTALDQGFGQMPVEGMPGADEDWGPDGLWGTEDDPPFGEEGEVTTAAEPVDTEDLDPAQEAHAEDEPAHGPATAATGEHGEHEPAHFDIATFASQALNFLVWFAIIVLLLRKPLTEYLKNRRLSVEEGLIEAKRLTQEANDKYDEYSERLERLDEELEKLRQEMIQAGEAERDRIIAEAEARAARMRKDAQFIIDQQVKQMRSDLTREAIEAAVQAAESVLVAQTGAGDQQKLAEAYLERLAQEVRA